MKNTIYRFSTVILCIAFSISLGGCIAKQENNSVPSSESGSTQTESSQAKKIDLMSNAHGVACNDISSLTTEMLISLKDSGIDTT